MAMIGLGLAPRPLVDSRLDASDEILRLRQERLSRQQKRQAEVLLGREGARRGWDSVFVAEPKAGAQ
jgi:hypothetical protein